MEQRELLGQWKYSAWYHNNGYAYHYTFVKNHYTIVTSKMNHCVNYNLWVNMVCQCRFTSCSKCSTLVAGIDNSAQSPCTVHRLEWLEAKVRTRPSAVRMKINQFSSVPQSCPTLYDTMGCSTPGFPVHHQLPEFTQTHAHRVGDAIKPSHPLSSPSPTALNLSQNQGIFQWVSSSHQVAKVLEFQL